MTNIFMKQVRDIKRFSIFHPIATIKSRGNLRKFVKQINTGSPSFGVLWNFADFIKYAEKIYFTPNNKNGKLYSSSDYKPGENGFKINSSEISITCKLFSEEQIVGLDVEYKQSHAKENYTFVRNSWESEPDEYDEILIDRLIGIINANMLCLLEDCINIKFNTSPDIDYYNLPH